MKKVTIIGPGLIGGSLGLALKKSKKPYFVTGAGRNAAKLKLAKKLGAVDAFTTDLVHAVKDADIIVICTPVDIIPSVINKIRGHINPGAVITDAGSVKSGIMSSVKSILKKDIKAFVGAHPMAGLEKQGVLNASKDLFRGAYVAIVPNDSGNSRRVVVVNSMWKDAGARTFFIKADAHDKIVARTSHLPHALAFVLSGIVGSQNSKSKNTSKFIAGSFKDMTRIADSSPHDWAAICTANRKETSKAIDEFISGLNRVKAALGSRKKLGSLFELSKLARQRILNKMYR